MKVRELIKELEKLNPEASVVSQEYTGCLHTIHNVDTIVNCPKDSLVYRWDESSNTKVISKSGICKTDVIYIN